MPGTSLIKLIDTTTPIDQSQILPPQCAGMTFDNIIVGSGDINGGSRNDLIYGSPGNDNIRGGLGDDCIIGGGGDDTLRGQNGDGCCCWIPILAYNGYPLPTAINRLDKKGRRERVRNSLWAGLCGL